MQSPNGFLSVLRNDSSFPSLLKVEFRAVPWDTQGLCSPFEDSSSHLKSQKRDSLSPCFLTRLFSLKHI